MDHDRDYRRLSRQRCVGILAKGDVTRKDYLEVVIPTIEKALKRNAKLRLFF